MIEKFLFQPHIKCEETTEGCEMVRYCTFREQNPHLWRGVDWLGMTKMGNIFEGVLYDRPDVGRLIICNLALWNPDEIPIEDLLRSMLLLLEIGIMQPKLQVLGGMAILDCGGMTMRQARQFTPSIALQGMNIMGLAFPVNQRAVHVVNCSRVFEMMFHFFKRLVPADELWKKVYFHGYNLNSMHRYLDPECLPKRYGGSREPVSLQQWLIKARQYGNQEFENEMRNLGYS